VRVSSFPRWRKSQVAKLTPNPQAAPSGGTIEAHCRPPQARMPFKKGHKGHPRKSLGSKLPRDLIHSIPGHPLTTTPPQGVLRLYKETMDPTTT
jgi:hypothetical protein